MKSDPVHIFDGHCLSAAEIYIIIREIALQIYLNDQPAAGGGKPE